MEGTGQSSAVSPRELSGRFGDFTAVNRVTLEVARYDIATRPERIKEQIGYMSQKFSLYGDLHSFQRLETAAGSWLRHPSRASDRLSG